VTGMSDLIYHLALRAEWDEALTVGSYRRSTLGRSLDDVGYIHCSFADQVQLIADAVYRGREDVVLLVVDTTTLTAEVRVENLDGGALQFPHIYGALPVTSVTATHPLTVDADGRLDAAAFLAGA
jgi:uncharacterized protein (DUF952 family)